MPQAIDIIVNNGAATPVAKTFTLLNPSSGNDTVAEWALKEGAISSAFPRLTLSAAPSKARASRVTKVKLKVPYSYVDSQTTLTSVGNMVEFNGTVSVPDSFPEALRNDAAAYISNIMANALVKACFRDGYGAT